MLDAATFSFARGKIATSLADASTRDNIFASAGDSKHGSLLGRSKSGACPATANHRWKILGIGSQATFSLTGYVHATK